MTMRKIERVSGIFQVRNIINNNIFLGSSANIHKAQNNIKSQLKSGISNARPLQEAWNEFGEANFIFETVVTCPAEMLVETKQALLDQLKPAYNICQFAGSTLGQNLSEETIAKITITKHTETDEYKIVSCVQCGREIRLNKGNTVKFEEDNLCSICRGKIVEKKICPGCGINLILPDSKLCYSCNQKGPENNFYKDGWTTEKRVCKNCGKEISLGSTGLCSKCYSKTLTGEGNPNYKGGKTLNNPYFTLEYKEWRTFIFERDQYTCKQCGCKESGNFEVHHILPRRSFPELTFDINNGITLCKKCHEATFGKEMNFVEKFQSLINQNNLI
jgi:group I intron endonuclease